MTEKKALTFSPEEIQALVQALRSSTRFRLCECLGGPWPGKPYCCRKESKKASIEGPDVEVHKCLTGICDHYHPYSKKFLARWRLLQRVVKEIQNERA